MKMQENLLFNYASIVATTLATATALVIIINKLRKRWPVEANCWFCNVNTKIWRSEIDWWQCPSCQQFNGFSEDGDYNYDIPEQRHRSLNDLSIYSASCRPEKPYNHNAETLCRNCNRNEELKLYQMRLLDPLRLSKKEMKSCRKSLEKQYPLCRRCNSLVKSVLRKQSVWLTQYKMLLFKQRPISLIVNNSEKLEKLCRIILIVLSSIIIGFPTSQVLPMVGALLQFFTATRKFNFRSSHHLLLVLIWLGVCTLMPFCGEQLVRLKLRSHWFTLEYITGHQVITFLSTILGFVNATSTSPPSSGPNLSFKKMDTSSSDLNSSRNSSRDELDTYLDEETELQERKSPVNITHLLTSPSPLENPAPIKPVLAPNFKVCNSQLGFARLDSRPEAFNTPLWKDYGSHHKKTSLNDSLRTLSSLSLNERDDKISSRNSKVFETRTYGTTSPDLFKKNSQTLKKFVLSPPKLKSVTQNSWVAGGYWQLGMDRPTLSRSSSQSSGFGSTGSNFPPSREPSVVNDVDRYSVMSDTTLCCNYPNNISPINSFCQYTSSPYRVMGQEIPICISPSPSLMSSTSCGQISQRTLCHSHHVNDQCIKPSPVMMQQSEPPICINHPTTVLTNPSWLPVLVCGSLVFNVIVFCTILLR
ncbi:uncharacterized protein [Fopius arisanus]|uniref:TMEM201 protein n=1 Tax=Fopius arisanus TaxID=64838 RepID=A0A0C9QR16_9HYME|nr:PREDICTED: uncharacterized protein LOC105264856 [Fopius arisanus]